MVTMTSKAVHCPARSRSTTLVVPMLLPST